MDQRQLIELVRCTSAYFEQYPDGRQRATDPDIVHVRVRPVWLRYSDYRPASFTIQEIRVTDQWATNAGP